MSAHDSTHIPTRAELIAATDRPLPRSALYLCVALSVIGLAAFLFALLTDADRAWRAFHFNWLFFAATSQAGVVFVAVQRITTARWSRAVVRLLEGYVAFLPVAFVLLALTLTVGYGHVFPWTHEALPAAEKRFYFSRGFHVGRDLAVFAAMTLLSLWYIYTCVRLDVGLLPEAGANWARGWRERMRRGFREERREIHSTHSLQGKLAVFMALGYGMLYSVLAWDLSMGLDVHFQSTLYSWWFFMGAWLAALMSWSLLTMWWRRYLNVYDLITEHHIHDLGKLCFAFTAFWGYLTFGQYLVIWYGNMGEETHFMHLRLVPPWTGNTMLIVFLVFVFPFFGLISRAAKVYLPTFVFFALCSVLGIWLLRYNEVYPSLYWRANVRLFGVPEVGIGLGYLGLWGLCYMAFMNAFPRVRTTLMTSPFRDEVQVPVDPDTMEPLPAHE